MPPKKDTMPLSGVGHGVHNPDDVSSMIVNLPPRSSPNAIQDMIISKPAIVFHAIEIFFTFLAMACFAATAAFETQWGIAPGKG